MQNILGQSQDLLLKQTLSLKQIQYLNLLSMNMTELGDYLNSVYEENPIVEFSSAERDEKDSALDFFSDLAATAPDKPIKPGPDDEAPSEITPKGQILDERENLYSFLKSQFDFSLRSFDISLLGVLLASLDKRGYLSASVEEISARGYDRELVEEAISYLQSLEPAGIGARDLTECLHIQFRRKGVTDPIPYKIVSDHLEDLAKGYFKKIAKALSCSDKKVRDTYDEIRKLNPIPSRGFGIESPFSYIVPDVTVINDSGKLSVRYNQNFEGSISINQGYVDLASKDRDAEKYIKEKAAQAMWVMKALQSRRETIENIVEVIVLTQDDFFLKGKSLKPLKLRDVAKALSIHESTVSRAINDKYLECPRGIFPLKYFFTGEITKSFDCDEEPLSAESLKERISEIIKSENPTAPYSDNAIMKILQAEGIMIARRTVAKYRSELNIAGSSVRKKV